MVSTQETTDSLFVSPRISQLVTWNKRRAHGKVIETCLSSFFLVLSSSLPPNTCRKTAMHINYHELLLDLCLTGAEMQVYQRILEHLNITKFLVLLEIALLFPVLQPASEVLDHDKYSPMQGRQSLNSDEEIILYYFCLNTADLFS